MGDPGSCFGDCWHWFLLTFTAGVCTNVITLWLVERCFLRLAKEDEENEQHGENRRAHHWTEIFGYKKYNSPQVTNQSKPITHNKEGNIRRDYQQPQDIYEEPIKKRVEVMNMSEYLKPEKIKVSHCPPGLMNLGNMCYFNSCIQLLKEIDASIWNELLKNATFIDNFSQFHPFRQEDAQECLTSIISHLANGSMQKNMFVLETKTTKLCTESDEVEEIEAEYHYQMICHLSEVEPTLFLQTGLKKGLDQEQVEKYSTKLGRDTLWKSETRLTRLPNNLLMQLSRFKYNKENEEVEKLNERISIPQKLDLHSICTPALQNALEVRRSDAIKEEKMRLDMKRRNLKQNKQFDGISLPTHFDSDPGSNNSGYYTLKGIITHKGHSAREGHYAAWIRSNQDNKWRLFDDEQVTVVDEKELLQTAGGDDMPSAYILLYEARVIKKYPELPPAPIAAEIAADKATDELMKVSSKA